MAFDVIQTFTTMLSAATASISADYSFINAFLFEVNYQDQLPALVIDVFGDKEWGYNVNNGNFVVTLIEFVDSTITDQQNLINISSDCNDIVDALKSLPPYQYFAVDLRYSIKDADIQRAGPAHSSSNTDLLYCSFTVKWGLNQ